MPGTRTIEQTHVIAAPREEVFRALTDAEVLNTWWTTRANSDARAGGEFAYDWEFEDAARDHHQAGTYIEVGPNRAIAYPWSAGPAGEQTVVRFTLGDAGDGGCEVRLSHSGFSSDAATDEVYEAHDGGWARFLENLKSVLEGGPDRRAEIGLKVPTAN